MKKNPNILDIKKVKGVTYAKVICYDTKKIVYRARGKLYGEIYIIECQMAEESCKDLNDFIKKAILKPDMNMEKITNDKCPICKERALRALRLEPTEDPIEGWICKNCHAIFEQKIINNKKIKEYFKTRSKK